MPRCTRCGKGLPWADLNAIYHEGKLVCPRCSVLAKIKSPRFLPIPVLPPTALAREPSASEKTKQRINIVASLLSLAGLAIIDLNVFRYFPQYSTWAVVGSSVLLSLYHPWWRHNAGRPDCDRVFMGSGVGEDGYVSVKADSWHPMWVCESCGHVSIEQIETGQMFPCRDCGHENENFGPNVWSGECADSLRRVTINEDLMRERQGARQSSKKKAHV